MLFVLPVLKSGITVFGLKIRIFSLKFIFVDLSQLFKNFQGCITVYLSKINFIHEVEILRTEKEGFEPSRRY